MHIAKGFVLKCGDWYTNIMLKSYLEIWNDVLELQGNNPVHNIFVVAQEQTLLKLLTNAQNIFIKNIRFDVNVLVCL